MPSLAALSQVQWAVLGLSAVSLLFLYQCVRIQTAVAERQRDGWHALPESDGTKSYRAASCEDRFIADLTDHFPGQFSDEDRLQIRLFLQGLPADFRVFLRSAPVRIYHESNRPEESVPAIDHLPPQQDFWIQSLSSKSMACYHSVFTIPPEHYLGYDPEEWNGRPPGIPRRFIEMHDHDYDRQRLVFACPEEDGRDDTILAFVPKYVRR